MYFLTSTPLSWPFWPQHLLLGHAWTFRREHPDPSPPDAHWGSLGSRSPCPSPWMVAVAEAGDKKGLLPHLKPGAVTHFLPELLNPFSLFSPSSLRVAVSKLLPAHGQVHKPLTGTGTESMSQKTPQGPCSHVGHCRPSQDMKLWFYLWVHMEPGCFAGPNSMAHLILCWAELLWCWCGISNGQMLWTSSFLP